VVGAQCSRRPYHRHLHATLPEPASGTLSLNCPRTVPLLRRLPSTPVIWLRWQVVVFACFVNRLRRWFHWVGLFESRWGRHFARDSEGRMHDRKDSCGRSVSPDSPPSRSFRSMTGTKPIRPRTCARSRAAESAQARLLNPHGCFEVPLGRPTQPNVRPGAGGSREWRSVERGYRPQPFQGV
jgi:hypothetical protein